MSNEFLLEEAIQISKKIISESHKSNDGIYWESNNLNANGFQEDLYSGNAGIILFLIEVHRITKDESLNILIRKALSHIYIRSRQIPCKNTSLITGRMGVVFVMLYYGRLTLDKDYTHKALELAKGCKMSFQRIDSPAEYLNGLAGTLMGFLVLHSFIKEKWVEAEIKEYLKAILLKADMGLDGVFWDKSVNQIKPLCGISHGNSGISIILDVLAYVSKNSFLHWLAKQGYYYEDTFYNSQYNNWPDYRLGAYKAEELKSFTDKYKTGEYSSFLQPNYMKAWCHGAPGISFARLNSFQLFNDPYQLKYLKKQVDELLNDALPNSQYPINWTLCHGLLGNYLFLREFDIERNNETIQKKLLAVAKCSIEQNKKFKYYLSGYPSKLSEDNSLFMGEAGVGLSYLNIYNQESINVLNPISFLNSVSKHNLDLVDFNDQFFLELMISKKTKLYGKQMTVGLNSNNQVNKDNGNFISTTKFTVSDISNILIKRAMGLWGDKNIVKRIEEKKNELLVNIESLSFLHIRKIVNREFILITPNNELMNSTFKISNTFVFLSDLSESNDRKYILYYDIDNLDISMISLNRFEIEILEALLNNRSIRTTEVNATILKKLLFLNIIYVVY